MGETAFKEAERVAPRPQRPAIELRGVSHTFPNGQSVLQGVDLEVAEGEFVSVVGPSGCGKSTLLGFVAGIGAPSAGEVRTLGVSPAEVRPDVGYIFQRDALLPWRTALDNVALPLRFRGVGRRSARATAHEWLARVGLPDHGTKYPHQLSGGMRKRVAIAATLAYEPRVLLMDEPYSALDVQTRITMENDLLALWAQTRQTVVFVTHDLEEAVGLADRVVVLSRGPARVVDSHDIPLDRPRDLLELRFRPEFREICERVWRDLRQSVVDPGEA